MSSAGFAIVLGVSNRTGAVSTTAALMVLRASQSILQKLNYEPSRRAGLGIHKTCKLGKTVLQRASVGETPSDILTASKGCAVTAKAELGTIEIPARSACSAKSAHANDQAAAARDDARARSAANPTSPKWTRRASVRSNSRPGWPR